MTRIISANDASFLALIAQHEHWLQNDKRESLKLIKLIGGKFPKSVARSMLLGESGSEEIKRAMQGLRDWNTRLSTVHAPPSRRKR